jgi:hypothetical protein
MGAVAAEERLARKPRFRAIWARQTRMASSVAETISCTLFARLLVVEGQLALSGHIPAWQRPTPRV